MPACGIKLIPRAFYGFPDSNFVGNLSGKRTADAESTRDMSEVLDAIYASFPVGNPPRSDEVVAEFVPQAKPLEAVELFRELGGRPWNEVDSEFIEKHGDWLVYLAPQAFAYFLPAWLVYGLDYPRAGYVADWTVSFFAHPPASEPMSNVQSRMIDALDSLQKSAVIRWITYLIEAYPESDPGHLKKQGLDIEDAVYNLSLRPYDLDGQSY